MGPWRIAKWAVPGGWKATVRASIFPELFVGYLPLATPRGLRMS